MSGRPTTLPANFYQRVYRLVARIPRGRVMTYGQVATYLDSPRAARAVGYALMHLTDEKVPWHRVINAQGGISVGGRLWRPQEQVRRLQREGVAFDADGRVPLARFLFTPGGRRAQPSPRAGKKARSR